MINLEQIELFIRIKMDGTQHFDLGLKSYPPIDKLLLFLGAQLGDQAAHL